MNNLNKMEIINNTITNILEQTAFMFPEPVDMDSGIPLEDFDFILIQLNFSGDKAGIIKMIVPFDFCAEFSANLLGEEIENVNSEESKFDSAKELLNIVSGQLLINFFGDKALFNLTNLEASKLEKEAIFPLIEECEYHCCMVDDYPIITIFTLQEATSDEYKSINS